MATTQMNEPLHYTPAADAGGCADGSCDAPVVAEPSTGASSGEQSSPMTMWQFFGAIGTLLLALPAIIGACCWPMLVAAIFNVGASVMNGGSGTGIVDFFHGLQVAIMLALMLNLVQFVWWTCKLRRPGTFWVKHQPTLIVLLSAIMVNIQPMLILVIGSWKLCCAPCTNFGPDITGCAAGDFTYPPWSDNARRACSAPGGNIFWDVSYCNGSHYPIFPVVASGWAIQCICTWGGYVLMFIGVFQATQLHIKLGNKWRALRNNTRQPVISPA